MDQGELGQYRAMLCRFLLFLLRDPHDAEELAQETFRVAISKGADPAKGTDYGAWLRSIARNLVRNHVRKHRRRALLRGDVVALAERRFVETGADRDEVWEARRAALARCMARLPEDDQALLRRRYERGEKVKSIARELHTRPNSLSKRLERIRERLAKCINAAVEDEPSG